jgi:hypothetical protein
MSLQADLERLAEGETSRASSACREMASDSSSWPAGSPTGQSADRSVSTPDRDREGDQGIDLAHSRLADRVRAAPLRHNPAKPAAPRPPDGRPEGHDQAPARPHVGRRRSASRASPPERQPGRDGGWFRSHPLRRRARTRVAVVLVDRATGLRREPAAWQRRSVRARRSRPRHSDSIVSSDPTPLPC